METPEGEITCLLRRWHEGSRDAENQLFTLAMPNLRRLAHYLMQRERKGHSLQATELVDQIYFSLVAANHRHWQNRKHFFALAARAMRRHLMNHARGRASVEFVVLEGFEDFIRADNSNLELAVAVDRLLDEMAETKPDWSTLVEMKFFLGLDDEEAAGAMGMKLRSMQRTWSDARRWLFTRMNPADLAHVQRP